MSRAAPIRIGTRASPLARWQAQWVADALAAFGAAVELVPITTRGDSQAAEPIAALGGTGIFTRELQRALLDERIDVAVHSLKDLPTEPVAGLILAAVPRRESPFDVLVSHDGAMLASLPGGARIGTGSLRRQSQLLHLRPDLQVVPVRGNVDTRLRKLDGDVVAAASSRRPQVTEPAALNALVLAEAGLNRLGLSGRVTQVFAPSELLPAVGQGALGLETRTADAATRAAVDALNDSATHAAVLAERSLLETVGGGCLAPIGAWARLDAAGQLQLDAVVLSSDGSQRLHAIGYGSIDDPQRLGSRVADQLLEQGAAALIESARGADAHRLDD